MKPIISVAKKDIRSLSLSELNHFFTQCGEKSFRAKQVYEWLWKKSCPDFDDMTNISISTRALLKGTFTINTIRIDTVHRSKDGTLKSEIRLHDNLAVESALIPSQRCVTACVSSQAGCSLDCKFCATSRLKNMRNLSTGEIYDQVVAIDKQAKTIYHRPLTNVVFMGMGEPLLNYANVCSAIDKITSPKGLNMASRKVTLSTVGIPKMIVKMADEDIKCNLAISLHSACPEVRAAIMPISSAYTLKELAKSLVYWYSKRRRKLTYEYIIWKGINDNQKHIDALLKFCKIVPSKVNIIEYNPIRGGAFSQADDEVLSSYQHILEKNKITVRIRKSRGRDIDAACGQLANVHRQTRTL